MCSVCVKLPGFLTVGSASKIELPLFMIQKREGSALMSTANGFGSTQTFIVLALTSSIALTGCSNVAQIVQDPRAAFMSASDPCSSSREPFVEVREKQRNQIVKWTAVGAWAGAAAAIVRKDTDAKKVLGGAVAGGLIGAVSGYYYNLNKRATQTEQLRKTVFADAEIDAVGGDKLVAGVSRLNACRMKSLDEIVAGVQSGQLSKSEARSRLDFVKRLTQGDNKLIESVSEGLAKRSSIYVSALQLSGADDAEKYIEDAKAYEPIVQKPMYAISRAGSSQSATVTFSESPLSESEARKKAASAVPTIVQEVVDRPPPTPIAIKKRSKRNENSVTATAKGAAELDAMVVAHVESVDEAIHNIEAVLL